ncbi:hypothetical protein G646_gp063 [Serratia phage phiMAM1]|uniref:Uncharacterized protein n=1 Tax=Serratia phage phiMAM1 TaxID=1262513 RepID=K7YIS0_9CAUD|nr:hypothetical protein G646_gp063 [Serratia phage phiMAM1]AFX93531.1 hypothetical protein MAM_063 [Serratia phage phiMAM1]
MKTIEQVVAGYKSETLDGRDIGRLADFLTVEQLKTFDLELCDDSAAAHVALPLTREAVMERLERDLAFAFEKALSRRGISAGMMFYVIKMWNYILEDGLEDFDDNNYAQYGLPLFKATAVHYGLDNPIGDDSGSEHKYSSEG